MLKSRIQSNALAGAKDYFSMWADWAAKKVPFVPKKAPVAPSKLSHGLEKCKVEHS